MTRALYLLALLAVLLLPVPPSTAFDSPLVFESPLSDSDDGRISAQTVCVYLLPCVPVGRLTE